MRKQTIPAGALSLVLALLLAACSSATPAPTPSSDPAPTPSPSAQATPVADPEPPEWGDQVLAKNYTAEDGTQVMSVSYTLPLVRNPETCPAGQAINAWYEQLGQTCMAGAEENYQQVAADYDVSHSTDLPFTPVTEEMSYEVLLSTDQVISIRRTWYINSGGAYPTVFQLGELFDPQTGIKLASTDFFTDAAAVKTRVVDAFLDSSQLAGLHSRAEVEAAYQAEQFCLTSEGYAFWIQGNSLTGVHSPVEVVLPYDALKDVSMYAAQ